MRIVGGTLLITSAIFLNPVESSSQVTLLELFPKSHDGVLPRLKTEQYDENDTRLRQLRRFDDNHHMLAFDATSTLVKRGNVIIGWALRDHVKSVHPPSGESGFVFDIDDNDFKYLVRDDLITLGVGCRLRFLVEREEAAAQRRRNLNTMDNSDWQASERAHFEAKEVANFQASFQSHIESRKRNQSHQASAQAIYQAYHHAYEQAYDEAYVKYLKYFTRRGH